MCDGLGLPLAVAGTDNPMRTLAVTLLVLSGLIAAAPLRASDASPDTTSPRTLSEYLARARKHNPAIKAIASEARASRERVGVARGLDDHARILGTSHTAMPTMGALLLSLADLVRAVRSDVLDEAGADVDAQARVVRERRQRCVRAAQRRAGLAEGDADHPGVEAEWLNYTAILVQVDRIVVDLSAPLPGSP